MRLTLLLAPLLALTVAGATAASAAPARPPFAPAAKATITPGVQTVTGGGQCTANFVFTAGKRVFLGQAAHCAAPADSSPTETNGCTARSRPLGTRVKVQGATRPAVLAYSSWVAMRKAKERDPNACAYNDFALVELHPADVRRTNPSVPVFGGPTGLATGTRRYAPVYSYGNSSLRFGVEATSPKYGVSLGDDAGGWNTQVYTATPGIPGDSGSGFLVSDGRAVGTLSTVALFPQPLSNGVSNLSKQLAYARKSIPGLTLVKGTERFRAL